MWTFTLPPAERGLGSLHDALPKLKLTELGPTAQWDTAGWEGYAPAATAWGWLPVLQAKLSALTVSTQLSAPRQPAATCARGCVLPNLKTLQGCALKGVDGWWV